MKLRLAAIIVPLASPAASQPFTAFELEDMVKSSHSTCLRAQQRHPDNVGADPALIVEYCRCYANKMTARVTRQEVESFEQNNQLATAAMIEKAQKIGAECQAELIR